MASISVIIPLFNKEHFIKKTLLSVLSQTFSDFEVLLINDGSTDGSVDVVSSFIDERITLHTTKNKGVSHARNYGVSKSSSDLIAFLDADDIWNSKKIEYQVNYMKKNNLSCSHTSYDIINENNINNLKLVKCTGYAGITLFKKKYL